jgi:16S rRNA G966 N2-methylase RsmD
VFLDPPYSADAWRDNSLYREESTTVAHDVRDWAIENGKRSDMRIALCGYIGEHEMPDNWECVRWKTIGGYESQAKGGKSGNCKLEAVWFSPSCLGGRQGSFF